MSTATELLRRALDKWDAETASWTDLFEEIRAFLAAEPEADKPVAWMRTTPNGDQIISFHQVDGFEPLYTRPEPSRPMTEEYIRILYGDDNNFELTAPYVIAFARAVERYHGIKKDDEFCDSHCTWLDHHPDCKQFIPKTEAKNPPLATAIGQAVKITENGDHIAYEIFDGDKWLRLEPAIRKPMTEEEIQKGVKRLKEMVGNKSSEVYAAFEVGIRVAEKYHEIGGGDE